MKHVVFAIPAYNGTIELATMRGIISDMVILAARGDRVTLLDECGNAAVADGRAMIAARFLHETDGTHLVCIDDDVVWPEGTLARLVDAPYEFTAAIYPHRKDPITYAVRWASEHQELRGDPATGWLEVGGVATGCMCLERSVLDKMIAAYPQTAFWNKDAPDQTLYDLYGPWREGIIKYGEDFSFCERWRAIGGKIFIDPEIKMGHIGKKTFVGSLGDWLRANNMPQPEPDLSQLQSTLAALEGAFTTEGLTQ